MHNTRHFVRELASVNVNAMRECECAPSKAILFAIDPPRSLVHSSGLFSGSPLSVASPLTLLELRYHPDGELLVLDLVVVACTLVHQGRLGGSGTCDQKRWRLLGGLAAVQKRS